MSTAIAAPESSIPLWVQVVGEDHPKACTGRRLLRRGLARDLARGRPRGPRPIVLDPHADVPLSAADRDRARRTGVLAIDCSWNRLGERGRLPETAGASGRAPHRRLPWLLAANPQHYGRLSELNTAEALGAALAVLGEGERAARLLSEFPGGGGFIPLNRAPLERYALCADAAAIVQAETEFF